MAIEVKLLLMGQRVMIIQDQAKNLGEVPHMVNTLQEDSSFLGPLEKSASQFCLHLPLG